MTITHINASAGATLTPAVVVGDLVYTAGQVGIDPTTGATPDDFAAEVELALEALESVLADAGSDLSSIVKASCFVTDISLVPVFNEVYRARIPEPRPARSTIEARLVPPYRFEIEVVARVRTATERRP
ncbi:RidA family protein [Microbacterium paludicola]|uniref:RidA family protein n=1 Tax=Microbacterium paludicola TaxID=300019 RepID=A0A4Y9FUA5_9MICO|nr:RidA family protein [Microbacterium paludicola]MBF0817174.1 RidA family protein [Microbacterium paludicola]TFU32102.1 RidA family protein [Microbacterium paludicola]